MIPQMTVAVQYVSDELTLIQDNAVGDRDCRPKQTVECIAWWHNGQNLMKIIQ